jgi:hypothetical protein
MIASIAIILFSSLLLSSFELPAVIYTLLFYVFTFFYTSFRTCFSRDLATVAIISSIIAFLISGLIGLALGNNISFMLRYSGGALLLPSFFFLSSLSDYKLNQLVRCIFISAFFFSVIAVLYLIASLAGLGAVSDFLSLFLGKASKSGYQDTRFYSLTLLTSSLPLSFILIFFARGFLHLFNLSKNTFNILYLRIFGGLFSVSGLFLLFSKSYVFYFLYIIIFACCCNLRSRIVLSKKAIASSVPLFLVFIISTFFIIRQIDISRMMGTVDFLNYDDNIQRFDQIDYYLKEGFTIIGDGLGSSFLNTPILRSWDSPYGLENSIINLLFKFGLFSLLFLPLVYFIVFCFLKISIIFRHLTVKNDITLMAIATAPSYSYFILVSVGNPILFHVQLDFLLLIFIVFSQRYISKATKIREPLDQR